MRNDLISRCKLFNRLATLPAPAEANTFKAEVYKIIQEMETEDRPQGEWIDKGWKGDWQFETDGRGHCWKVFECSVCNGWDTRKTRFCPHCGAQMKGADYVLESDR